MAKHSLVFPVFNEELGLDELMKRLTAELLTEIKKQGDDYEIVFVDDGSRDASFKKLQFFYETDRDRIVVLKFSRNFGHQVAVTAGMDYATGDTITVMDADLQDPPYVVLEMIQKWREGYDVVYGQRKRRLAESFFKRATASLFYRALKSATQIDIPLDTGDFRLMSRRAAQALNSMREQNRFVRGMAAWVGFKSTSVLYVREARFQGETHYPLKKMLKLAWDGFAGFSQIPLRVATLLGLLSASLSFVVAIWALYIHFFTETAVQGWTSTMVVVLFIGGVQMICVGLLGEYVGRIFEQSKQRPLYIVEEVLRD